MQHSLNFTPISLEGQGRYKLYLAKTPQIASDYSFGNIWGWAEYYGLEWAFTEELCWLRQTRNGPKCLWAPVGDWNNINWCEAIPSPCTIIRAPQMFLDALINVFSGDISIEETPGQWDYLYSVRELTELRGNRFHRKKNLFSQFQKHYAWTYESMTFSSVQQVAAMQKEWCTAHECQGSHALAAENTAIARILSHWDKINGLMGGIVRVDGKIAAYTIAEPLDQENLVIHFEKGLNEYKGVYQAINALFLARAASEFLVVNREQDLDEEGLRQAKKSYNPIGQLHKNTVIIA